MNMHTFDIARILEIDIEEAIKVHAFIEEWFDDFRFGSASNAQIARVAREAQIMMSDPMFKANA